MRKTKSLNETEYKLLYEALKTFVINKENSTEKKKKTKLIKKGDATK